MPAAHPREFRERAVSMAREGVKPIAQIAKDLGVSDSCLRGWIARADIEAGTKAGVNTDDRAELVRLRREVRNLVLENEILKRAAAYFARENVLPK